jgi:hypothetical protein
MDQLRLISLQIEEDQLFTSNGEILAAEDIQMVLESLDERGVDFSCLIDDCQQFVTERTSDQQAIGKTTD